MQCSSQGPLEIDLEGGASTDHSEDSRLATTLRQAGLRVEVHDDHFQQDATDEEWLAGVGQI